MTLHWGRTAFLMGMALVLSACKPQDKDAASTTEQLRSEIQAQGLTGDPAEGRQLPSINDPKAQLGKRLFFSQALGGDQDAACVTCHHPVLGGGDDLPLPIGVNAEQPGLLGPGRLHSAITGFHYDGGPTVPRNAPTTFNIAMWDQVLFHDGRAESLGKTPKMSGGDGAGIRTPDSAFGVADPLAGANLATAQSRFPVTSAEEMRGDTFAAGAGNEAVRTALMARLDLNWLPYFQQGFGQPAGTVQSLFTYANVADAIGTYENSQVFTQSPWRAFVKGDNQAISESAQRGALLFYRATSAGGAGCSSCHSGDFFTDEQFHVLAIPQIGRGKGDPATETDPQRRREDFGRYRETRVDSDRYAFRTPSLLNVTATGPWGHSGAYTSLEAVVRHHLDPEQAVDQYDFTAEIQPGIQVIYSETFTRNALQQLQQLQGQGRSLLSTVALTDAQVADLMAFLQSLTDPCVEDRACLAPWITDGNDTGPDGLQLNPVDQYGTPL